MSTTDTTARTRPTTIDPTASGTGDPVSWWARTPPNATTRPISAAASSAYTARSVGSDVTSTWCRVSRSAACASARACRRARRNDTPSSTNARARTA
ncbi:Uncharacterised protein [Mycobacteroides abscessus]|nr:Uncharacterised protein [Mycobacteroides abscessus]